MSVSLFVLGLAVRCCWCCCCVSARRNRSVAASVWGAHRLDLGHDRRLCICLHAFIAVISVAAVARVAASALPHLGAALLATLPAPADRLLSTVCRCRLRLIVLLILCFFAIVRLCRVCCRLLRLGLCALLLGALATHRRLLPCLGVRLILSAFRRCLDVFAQPSTLLRVHLYLFVAIWRDPLERNKLVELPVVCQQNVLNAQAKVLLGDLAVLESAREVTDKVLVVKLVELIQQLLLFPFCGLESFLIFNLIFNFSLLISVGFLAIVFCNDPAAAEARASRPHSCQSV
eukprot:TRINITY_DN1318_c1_g1_i4.p1 TRINITY_DN1318_c1_g1~~TRINITY_DN1318_c1_g1_i4.p1  ORF type:complete len:289 (+),score=35.55 TRINITY_DN1318_c1_g1_i4:204-1070(+)